MTSLVPAPEDSSERDEWEALVRGEQILADATQGTPLSTLCTNYGLTPASLRAEIAQALAQRIAQSLDAQREMQNVLLDDLMGRWAVQLLMAEEMARVGSVMRDHKLMDQGLRTRADALRGALAVSERRAKMNGLDAPTRLDADISHSDATDRALEELNAMMATLDTSDTQAPSGASRAHAST